MVAVSLVSAVVSAVLIYRYATYRREVILATRIEIRKITATAASHIDSILQQTMAEADGLTSDISLGLLSNRQILARLKQLAKGSPYHYGAAIAYRPYGYDPQRRLYAPYYNKKEGMEELVFTMVDYDYDYTQPEYEWYTLPMKEGNRWSDPYWCPSGKAHMVTYSSVFYEPGAQPGKHYPLGIVVIDISMDRLKKIIEDLDLGPSGFGTLVSEKGIFLHHPEREYVAARKRITDLARDEACPVHASSAEMAARGEEGILEHLSTDTRMPAWLVVAPIPTSGWSLQNNFLKRDIQIEVDTIRHWLIWIVSTILIGFLSSAAATYTKVMGSPGREWAVTAMGALCIAVGIGSIWDIALTYNPVDKIHGVKIFEKIALKNVVAGYVNRSLEKHMKPPIVVPTGVYIESVKFAGPNDLLLSGYIWQKYNERLPPKVEKQPMISSATDVKIQEMGSFLTGGNEVIIFSFEAEVRQKLSHGRYPLEQDRIELCLRPRDIGRNILLVPDLDAYAIKSASLLPGLDTDSFIPGWKLKNAYFELRKRELNTDFGLGNSVFKDRYPALYYNVGIQRIFVDAFISNLTPLIFVAIMLFYMLLLSNVIDGSHIISICVAMFFVIVFSHIDIRSKISAQEIFYLEYFFFLTYGSILYVAFNAGGSILKYEIPFCSYKSRRPSLLFWPVFLGIIFVVTMVVFLGN